MQSDRKPVNKCDSCSFAGAMATYSGERQETNRRDKQLTDITTASLRLHFNEGRWM